MYKWFLIFLLSFYFPAVSQESNEPFMEQSTRAQIWCEVISQDVYELSMIRHRGISQSDFLEAGKETFQGLGHRLRQRMNQEKEGIKVLRKLEAQIELEIKKTDKFWPVYEKIIEGLFSVARLRWLKMNFLMVAFCHLRAQVVVKFNYTDTPEEGVTNVGRFVSN